MQATGSLTLSARVSCRRSHLAGAYRVHRAVEAQTPLVIPQVAKPMASRCNGWEIIVIVCHSFQGTWEVISEESFVPLKPHATPEISETPLREH